jgi:hypothetical protein
MAATLCAVALATVACSLAAAGTARAELSPQPQKLWNAYPLDPKPAPPVRATATTPHPRVAPTTGPTSKPRSRADWYAATGVAAALLVLVTLAAAMLRWGSGAAAAGAVSSVRRPGSAGARLTARRHRAAERLMTAVRGTGRWSLPRARPQSISSHASSSAKGLRLPRVLAQRAILPAVVTQPRQLIPLRDSAEDAVRERTSSPPRHRETDPTTLDDADALLKRKTARAEAEAAAKLKAATATKTAAKRPREAQVPAPSEVELLKAKLTDGEGGTPVASDATPAAAQATGAPPIAPAKPTQPEPSVASIAPRRPRATPQPTAVCRIEWWRGYMTSEFLATCRDADGTESVVLKSPSFRWRKSTPPPKDFAPAAAAHGTLVAQLEAAGWVGERTRGDWYSLELHRPAAVAAASNPKGVA